MKRKLADWREKTQKLHFYYKNNTLAWFLQYGRHIRQWCWEENREGLVMVSTYNIFISHSWGYGDAYDTLVGFLDGHRYFFWKDYSVPKDDPIHHAATKSLLRSALRRHIAPASCVIVPAGVYCSYSSWIEEEIEMAQEMDKPIIAVRPWGADRMSTLVQDNADVVVGWNSDSIVNAVRNYSV